MSRWVVFLTALLSVAVGAAFAASATESVTLTFMNSQNTVASQWEEEIAAIFVAENPGVNVEFVNVANLEQYRDRLLTAFVGGSAPDVVMVHSWDVAAYRNIGMLMSLTPFIERDEQVDFHGDIIPALQDIYNIDGDVLAIPYTFAPVAYMFYNKDHFAESGLGTPDPNWSFEEFLEQMRRLRRFDGNQIVRYGTYSYHPNNWLYSWGGTLTDDWRNPTEITFDSPEAREGLEAYVSLFTEHQVAPPFVSYTTSFMSGLISTVYTGLWASSVFGGAGFDWDVTLPPVGKGVGRGYEVAARGYGVTTTTKHPELAYKFAAFLSYDRRAQEIRLISVDGKTQSEIPSRISLATGDLFATSPYLPESKDLIMNVADYVWTLPRHPEGLTFFQLVARAANEAIRGTDSLENALTRAAQEARGAFRR